MRAAILLALAGFCPAALAAQDTTAKKDSARKLLPVLVSTERTATPPALVRETLPVSASVTAEKAKATVNLVDTEDAVKYLPSVFLRKRNNGDTQATMATRTWGVSSSARSLVFADGVPLTALIANNNTIGGPRWGLISPVEIARIDMMYGPFSAAYAGNSMGAVMEITTRLPERREVAVTQTQALQTFGLYGTDRRFGTSQTSASAGDRFGKFAFWVSGNYQDSHSQPLAYVTSATFPAGTSGGFAETNKLGAAANVVGATGLLHTRMTNARAKLAYDLTPSLRAAYTLGYWKNDADAGVDPYLTKSGTVTYAGLSGFASGNYDLLQKHSAHSLSLRSDTHRNWDMEAVASRYAFDTDRQRLPLSATASDTFSTAGRIAVLDGTRWANLDLKATWHRGGDGAAHRVSMGAHGDAYQLRNPTFNTPNWHVDHSETTVATEGDGRTRTAALWLQDAWRVAPSLKMTVGGRYEHWRAFDGFNQNGSTSVTQPERSMSRFSPKAVIEWGSRVSAWRAALSVGKAYRFATPSELYQLVTTGSTFTSPDPNLKPDNVLSAELRVGRQIGLSDVQLALFQDDVHDAIISQFLPLVPNSPTLYSYVSNVDHVRSRGAELTVTWRDLFVRGLDVSGSATYLDARTLALSGRASATAPADAAVGKMLPNIPARRATFLATYRATNRLGLSLAGRYNSKIYTTLDNTDVHPNTYQGFSEWAVADTRATYRVADKWLAAFGVDNLFNRKYFLFHPFPQRTFVADLTFAY